MTASPWYADEERAAAPVFQQTALAVFRGVIFIIALPMGPIFFRELTALPRRGRFYLSRALFPMGLLLLLSTAWLMVTGAQRILSVGDLARFGAIVFQFLAGVQIVVAVFASAIVAASSVSQEKDRKTLTLLLMTRLSHRELVWGKLTGSLLEVICVVLAAMPVFFLMMMLGGISPLQIGRVLLVTLASSLTAGCVGVAIAFWREKTFQTLALVVLLVGLWLGAGEVIASGGIGTTWQGIPMTSWAAACSPVRAVLAAADAFSPTYVVWSVWHDAVGLYLFACTVCFLVISGVTMWRVRTWNSSDQQRDTAAGEFLPPATWDSEAASGQPLAPEHARQRHIDAQTKTIAQQSRDVWDNPVLWRECVTWAYGRKIMLIRIAYLVMAGCVALLVHQTTSWEALEHMRVQRDVLPPTVQPLAALYLASLAILNALSVTSITTERDGRSMDLLLATDLTPREFLFGKLGGICSVGGLMIVTPLALSVYMWWREGISLQNLLYLLGGLVTLLCFVMMLGVHCGMRYASSRAAIGVSMGTFFFLSLGVAICMVMMISFSDSFHVQLVPFVAIILGGGVGLFAALGAGNPSSAMAATALVVPFATFYVITSILLQQELPAFLVAVASYGFATAAMLVPALFEFDVTLGRTVAAGD